MKKMFVLVREELAPVYRCVQGCHAVALFGRTEPGLFCEWDNGTLVFLSVRFPQAIQHWAEKLESRDIFHVVYREPDLDQPTALACYDDGEIFRSLPTTI